MLPFSAINDTMAIILWKGVTDALYLYPYCCWRIETEILEKLGSLWAKPFNFTPFILVEDVV